MREFLAGAMMAAVLAAGAARGAEPASSPANRPAVSRPVASQAAGFEGLIKGRVSKALDALQAEGDLEAAKGQLEKIFDQAAAYGSDKQVEALREAAWALRLVRQLGHVPAEARPEALKLLRGSPELGHTLVFLIKDKDDVAGVYGLLERLRKERGGDLEKFAQLTAAICVVHDKPFSRHINEATPKSIDPLEIFDYYSKNESVMMFGVRAVPAELLVYVVDTTATVAEMKWAANKYGRDPMVGRRFFDIKYDYDNFRKDKPKKISQTDYTLPNIFALGGVCADQAYYAMAVGKAIGVPTAYATGQSAEVGHAWVGFLQAEGRKGWWNFNMGRYPEYQGVMGRVTDPQTREGIPDSYVSLTAELIGTKPADRQAAAALTDAALRIVALAKAGQGWPVAAPEGAEAAKRQPRKLTAEAALELLQQALNNSAGYAPAWFAVRDLASDGKLTLAQKKTWSDVLMKLCGQRYPDFALTVLAPMVESIDDPKEQNKLWNAAFNLFQARADLSAYIRMTQAEMWEKAKQPALAGQCYMDVVERYANAGPFVIPALAGAEQLLRSTNKEDKVIVLYGDTWNKIAKPQDMAGPFMRQSNWYQVGMIYAGKLAEAGRTREAAEVKAKLTNATAPTAGG